MQVQTSSRLAIACCFCISIKHYVLIFSQFEAIIALFAGDGVKILFSQIAQSKNLFRQIVPG
jgi:hypothetical protein